MKDYGTLYQHGTLALLVPGLLKGTMKIGELLKHGDTGIGTGEGLDGELIILDGKPYQVNGKGKVQIVSKDFTLPFSSVSWAKYQHLVDLENVDMSDFSKQMISLSKSANTFFSIKAQGTFTNIKTRAAKKSEHPYKTLSETADKQAVFTKDKVEGTLLGYYAPEIFNGAAVGGFHYHFLSDNHKFGGHVLSFHIEQASVYAQQFDTLEQHLPVEDKDYMKHDFSDDDVAGSIEKSEK